MMLQAVLPWVAGAFALAALLSAWRLFAGPSLTDRILALDTLSINALAVLVLVGIWQDTTVLFEAALLIALLSFIGTVALARYVQRRGIVE